MLIQFYKYHGTGNDFILLDCRSHKLELSAKQVAFLCHRHFGIGADGLMYLEHADGYDFRMVYFNSDGNESTMCGNGGRCIVAFAKMLGVIKDKANFVAIDGEHSAEIDNDNYVRLEMQDVKEINFHEKYAILNTGSPHYVLWTNDVENVQVFTEGRRIRNLEAFKPGGINVNFAKVSGKELWVRTYERGVEDETMSCGTGVVASAIASAGQGTGDFITTVNTPGGQLRVSYTKNSANSARNIILSGSATLVFKGEIALK